MTTKHTAKNKELTFYIIGSICCLVIIIAALIFFFGTKHLICTSTAKFNEKYDEETELHLTWMFGNLAVAKANISYTNPDTESGGIAWGTKELILNSFESTNYYSEIHLKHESIKELEYVVKYNLDNIEEPLGSKDYETVKKHLKDDLLMTCKNQFNIEI